MAVKRLAASFDERITTRSLARLHAWIAAGLVILYIITFPIFKSTMLVLVPVMLASGFYYIRGALVVSILAAFLNLFLITIFVREPDWNLLLSFRDGFLIGHI